MPSSSEHHSGEHHSHEHHTHSHHSRRSSGLKRKLRRLFSRRKLKKFAPLIVALILFPSMLIGAYLWEEKMGADAEPETVDTVILREKDLVPMDDADNLLFFDGGWYTPKEGLETTLLIGVDKNADFVSGEGGEYEQADFLLLMVADTQAESYTAIPINRDTMTDVMMLTTGGAAVRSINAQIALAHAYGARPEIGCRNTVRSVSGLLRGIEIDHYLSLSMDGVAVLNDAVGGVPVIVMDDLTGIDSELVQGEAVTLHGDQALTYIRARRGLAEATNIHRMERQLQYMMSLQSQFSRQADKDETFIMNTMLTISNYLVSDCTVDQLSRIIDNLHNYRSDGIRTLEGEVVYNKYAEFYPDEQELRRLVMDVFYEPVSGAQ